MMVLLLLLRETFLFCLRFLAGEIVVILRAVLLPTMVGGVALYLLLDGYCLELLDYLSRPNDVMASRVLGIAAAGGLVLLLLNAMVVASLTRLALREKAPERSFLGIGVAAWRLYTADQRLLLAVGIGSVALWLVLLALGHVWLTPDKGIVRLFILAALFWLGVRFWFFVAPFSVLGNSAGPLTDSWLLSAHRGWPIGLVLFTLLIVGIVFQACGEFLLRRTGWLTFPSPTSFRDAIQLYRLNMLPMTMLVSTSYLFATILLTAARAHLYRRFNPASVPAA
jgi:hypothetical protein